MFRPLLKLCADVAVQHASSDLKVTAADCAPNLQFAMKMEKVHGQVKAKTHIEAFGHGVVDSDSHSNLRLLDGKREGRSLPRKSENVGNRGPDR